MTARVDLSSKMKFIKKRVASRCHQILTNLAQQNLPFLSRALIILLKALIRMKIEKTVPEILINKNNTEFKTLRLSLHNLWNLALHNRMSFFQTVIKIQILMNLKEKSMRAEKANFIISQFKIHVNLKMKSMIVIIIRCIMSIRWKNQRKRSEKSDIKSSWT